MGCSPFGQCSEMLERVNTKGETSGKSYSEWQTQTGEKGAVWETGLFQEDSLFKTCYGKIFQRSTFFLK